MMDSDQTIIPERNRLSDEKTLEEQLESPPKNGADLPSDPDAHLSAEVRAAIVSFSKTSTKQLNDSLLADHNNRIANFCGSLI